METTTKRLSDLNPYIRQDKLLWNAIALLYIVGGYILGVKLLFAVSIWINIFGVFLLSHALFLSCVITHECIHSTLFAQQRWNEWVGTLMLWLNGCCYARFRDLTRLHIAHHVERADFPPVNLAEFIGKLPQWAQKTIIMLEWLYFPAVVYVMQWYTLTKPFWYDKRQDERLRTSVILLVRGLWFTGMAIASWKAVLLYFLAYTGMHLQRQFMDCFFHTYESFGDRMDTPQRDWQYEQRNTFSCLLSQKYQWLNLLILNFGYHNAHHVVMRCPWHSLPELDQELFQIQPQAADHRFTVRQVWLNYHRYRVSRLLSGHGYVIDDQGNYSLEFFQGDVGVGFLVLPV
ncbi:MAG: fatty acid desaturase [Oculatellaceae cyanobacterium Prado106]|jgi:fatty acid desaturase|nr:fatty acid desaturase [Oculatellaceae cyanobacterium Prado106]